MLHLDDPGLDTTTARGLRDYQCKVDNAGSYPEQVATGKRLFERYKHRTNRVFKVVRTRLADMCPGAQRCGYCEDSVGDEVEHIKPKDLYPQQVFVWENYLFACGQCNGGKNNRFSVISRGRLRDVTRRRNDPIRRPEAGSPALINPRDEDPLAFFDLEITETFVFLPRMDLSGIDEQRAHYTIDTLKLNRDVLLAARREAYGAYRARLFEYRQRRDNGASETALRKRSNAIMTSAHPTVWREMQRQRSLVDELRELFSDVPEALSW
ncbi:MAG: hypothetical protein OXC18_12450 [Desulfurellaceae bacterium]|nr:hypothetical protein [Desulfurellaceae bacterium]